jgi:hypothetical protein
MCSTNVCSSEDRFDRRIYDGYIDQENRRDNEASTDVNLFDKVLQDLVGQNKILKRDVETLKFEDHKRCVAIS